MPDTANRADTARTASDARSRAMSRFSSGYGQAEIPDVMLSRIARDHVRGVPELLSSSLPVVEWIAEKGRFSRELPVCETGSILQRVSVA